MDLLHRSSWSDVTRSFQSSWWTGCCHGSTFRGMRARADDGIGPVHVRVAALELRFQPDAEVAEVDQFPAQEAHGAVRLAVVLDADDEMPRVFGHFVRLAFRLEVKRAKAARLAAAREKLQIKIKNA